MYSIDCSYFDKSFKSISELVDHCILHGVDPNYEITRNGSGIGEYLIDFIQF